MDTENERPSTQQDANTTGPDNPALARRRLCYKNLPPGPWTQQLNKLPKDFCERSIVAYSEKQKARKSYARGLRYTCADKVTFLLIHYGEEKLYIKGKVNRSMSDKDSNSRKICIEMSYSGTITKAGCDCEGGARGRCSHVFAALWYINTNKNSGNKFLKFVQPLACTEKARVWGIRNTSGRPITSRFVDLAFVKTVPGKTSKTKEMIRKRKERRRKVRARLTLSMLENFHNSLEQNNVNQTAPSAR